MYLCPTFGILAYVFLPLWEALLRAFKFPNPEYAGIAEEIFSSPAFWLQILLCYLIAFLVYWFHLFACLYLVIVRAELCDGYDCNVAASTSSAIRRDNRDISNDFVPPAIL